MDTPVVVVFNSTLSDNLHLEAQKQHLYRWMLHNTVGTTF